MSASAGRDWLTYGEAAEHAGVSVTTFYKWVNLGYVKKMRLPKGCRSRVARYSRKQLDDFLNRHLKGVG